MRLNEQTDSLDPQRQGIGDREVSSDVMRLRGAYTSFARGEIGALLSALDKSVRWDASEALLHTGTYSGHDGVLRYLHGLGQHWEDFMLEAQAFSEPEPGHVIVSGTLIGRDRSNGELCGAHFTHHVHLRDGLVVELRVIVQQRSPDAADGGVS